MPYKLVCVGSKRYKVCKYGTDKTYSKEPMTKEKAEEQMKALDANAPEDSPPPKE